MSTTIDTITGTMAGIVAITGNTNGTMTTTGGTAGTGTAIGTTTGMTGIVIVAESLLVSVAIAREW